MVGKSTLYDVALKAGVSTGTVSHAFHHPELIKEDTKMKVLDAARELHYFPSGNARGLASGKTNAIGLFSFDMLISSPLWYVPKSNSDGVVEEPEISTFPLYVDEIEHGFELECKERDQALVLQALPNGKYESFVDSVGRVDGVALVEGFKPDIATIKALCDQRPVVLLSEPKSSYNALSIQVDNVAGTYALLDHLVLTHHVRDVAFLGTLDSPDSYERYNALMERAKRYDISVTHPSLGKWGASIDQAMAEARTFVEREDSPQAVVCVNDQLALSFMAVMRMLGRRIPEDVIVTGYDGILAGRFSSPKLTTVLQPSQAMGRLAARSLIERRGKPWGEPKFKLLPTKLVIGESCGCRRPSRPSMDRLVAADVSWFDSIKMRRGHNW